MSTKQKKGNLKRKRRNRIILALALFLIAYTIAAVVNTNTTLNMAPLGKRSPEQETELNNTLDIKYPERKSIFLTKSPFEVSQDSLSIKARSAIIVDTATGSIIYEKNADEQIPPASMTKIVEMYVVYEELEKGHITLDDIVPLPKESWEENIPWDATRMHLAEGQVVTLRELLLGLAVASANDASIAVANYVCGNMDNFVQRMNSVVSGMGLSKTSFVESSGYSEKNVTTAREFATFARQYVTRFPDSLKDFHSQSKIRYPEQKNCPTEDEVYSFTQYNTNKLLDKLAGCDGLKTGYIDESGYNISVTAEQNGTRFLSVTMGGPGDTSYEGNKARVQDNLNLFELAFENFVDYRAPQGENAHEYTVGIFGGKDKAVKLIPATDETFTVPVSIAKTSDSVVTIQTEAKIPHYIFGEIECGKQYGEIQYKLNGNVFRTIPLVADRSVKSGNIMSLIFGKTCSIFVDLSKGKQIAY